MTSKIFSKLNLKGLIAVVVVVGVAAIGVRVITSGHAAQVGSNNYPTSGTSVCGNTSLLTGPSTAPSGAVTVPAGLDSGSYNTPNTTYWFAPGVHTLGTSQYNQILPAQGDTYMGGPGAILSGQNINDFAFVASYEAPWVTNVTIEYLTIENFVPGGGEGAINQNAGTNWTFEYNTIEHNVPGAGLFLGSNDVANDNCLTENGEYGFSAYTATQTDPLTDGSDNITLTNNEVSYNNTCNWEAVSPNPVPAASRPTNCGSGQFSGCGCSGGGKFWQVNGGLVQGNYVHNNYDVGVWLDTSNNGFIIKNNYISSNYSIGVQYEVSYNALIEDNTFVDNAWGAGAANPGFPEPAVYISESGGDSRVPNTNDITTITISGNDFDNNWGGVALWENANRFCSNGLPNTNCTLVDPSVATVASCGAALSNPSKNQPTDNPDYFDLCRWKTQNVSVTGNTFSITPSAIGSDCTLSNSCGINALMSLYGVTGPYTNQVVPDNITFNQNNEFTDNTYNGPWGFDAWSQGNLDNPVSWADWTKAVSDKCNTSGEISSGTCDSGFGQDAGSTYNTTSSGPSTPTGVTATATSSTSDTLSWNASTDSGGTIAGYYVLRSKAGGAYSQLTTVSSSTTSFTDSSVTAGTNYTYEVEAYDTATPPDVSAPSAPASVLPSTPTGLTNTATTDDSVSLSWNASVDGGGPGVAGYYIIRNGVNITLNGVTGTSYTDTTVAASTTYKYQVEAYDSATTPDVSAASSAVSVTTGTGPNSTPPSQPTDFKANGVTSTQVNLSWIASTDNSGTVAGYYVYQNGKKLQTSSPITTTTVGVTGLKPSTSYSFYVIAYNTDSQDSIASTTATATTYASTTTTSTKGVVTSASSGKALAGVTINTGMIATTTGEATTTTNADGQYSIPNIIPAKSHSYYYNDTNYTQVHVFIYANKGVNTENVQLTKD